MWSMVEDGKKERAGCLEEAGVFAIQAVNSACGRWGCLALECQRRSGNIPKWLF